MSKVIEFSFVFIKFAQMSDKYFFPLPKDVSRKTLFGWLFSSKKMNLPLAISLLFAYTKYEIVSAAVA